MQALDILIIGDNDIVALCFEEALAAGHNIIGIVTHSVTFDVAVPVINIENLDQLPINKQTILVFCSPSYQKHISFAENTALSFNELCLTNVESNKQCFWFVSKHANFYPFSQDDFKSTKEEMIRDSFLEIISAIARDCLNYERLCSKIDGEISKLNSTNLYDAFDRIAKQYANKTALIYDRSSITYGELLQKVDNVSAYINDQQNFIGLCFKRNLNMIIAMLAVLKTGAAYVPLDSKNPIARNKYVVLDANLDLILCDDETYDITTGFNSAEVKNINEIYNNGIVLAKP